MIKRFNKLVEFFMSGGVPEPVVFALLISAAIFACTWIFIVLGNLVSWAF